MSVDGPLCCLGAPWRECRAWPAFRGAPAGGVQSGGGVPARNPWATVPMTGGGRARSESVLGIGERPWLVASFGPCGAWFRQLYMPVLVTLA